MEEYSDRAVREVQRAFNEGFEQSASELFSNYLENIEAFFGDGSPNEHDMKEIEKYVGVADRDRTKFRRQIHDFFSSLKRRGVAYDYTTEPRLSSAIEAGLFPNRRRIDRALSKPRFAKQQVEWRRERTAIYNRLINIYNYCSQCAEDTLEFVTQVLKGRPIMKTPKYEGIEWLWNLNPPPPDAEPSDEAAVTAHEAPVSTESRP